MKPAGLVEGERRKDAAFHVLKARRAALVRRAQRALLGILLDRGEATIDDVRDVVTAPDDVAPVAFGAMGNELAFARIIEAAGFKKSRRPMAHARPVTVWRLRDRDAALLWLDANPLYAEPLADAFPPMPIKEAASVAADAASTQGLLFS